MKRVIILAILSINIAAWADNYKILAIAGSKTVNIGGKELAEGAVFSDSDVVKWVSDRQIIKVCALDGKNKGRTTKISERAFAERGAKTMYRYVNMIGRGVDEEIPIFVMGNGDVDTLPIKVNPTCTYHLWYDAKNVQLNPEKGKLVVRSRLFGCGDTIMDVWVVAVDKNSGDMTPCYHFKADLAFAVKSPNSKGQKAERRIALVVANANYLDPQDRLNTPISDARAICDRLEELGFSVIKAFDKNYESLGSVIRLLASLSASYDVALFYYSGHGAQGRTLSGEVGNYMVPVNATIKENEDVVGRCISLGRVSDAFVQPKTRCAVRLLFVDACRNLPTFKSANRSGMVAADYPDCWAFFSTTAGSRSDDGHAEHSPFTQAWLETSKIKGISLAKFFTAISTRVKELTNGEQMASLTCNSSVDWMFTNSDVAESAKVKNVYNEPGIEAYRKATSMFAAENYEEAVRLYIIAAREGNHQAQGALGYCYYYGRGVNVNYEEAVHWYFEAASNGIDYAQCGLGMCYMKGNGVKQNHEEAVRWYGAAAAQGDEYAQYFMGICCSLGMGTEVDYDKAATWFTKSAMQGNPDAQEALASCYLNGVGVAKDVNLAKKWYIKAARGGNSQACKWLEERGVNWR